MAIVVWDCPFTLVSKYGSLNLNTATGYRYLLDPSRCTSGADLRVTVDNIPSGDGSIMHNIYSQGYYVNLYVQMWKDGEVACGSDLVTMFDQIQFHLNAMKIDTGRLIFTPPGHAARLLDQVRLTQRAIVEITDSNVRANIGFDLQSPFPYTINYTEIDTPVANGATFNFVNTGTADFYPVIEVYGPTMGGFIITNATTQKKLVFNPALPGASDIPAGHFVELDFFRNTAYEDGNQANEKKGIDIINSDFFPITPEPLGNVIGIVGTNMLVKWQAAFA